MTELRRDSCASHKLRLRGAAASLLGWLGTCPAGTSQTHTLLTQGYSSQRIPGGERCERTRSSRTHTRERPFSVSARQLWSVYAGAHPVCQFCLKHQTSHSQVTVTARPPQLRPEPHLPRAPPAFTRDIPAHRLKAVAGSEWRGEGWGGSCLRLERWGVKRPRLCPRKAFKFNPQCNLQYFNTLMCTERVWRARRSW